ncbi:leucine-rich repeat neuronal protein 2 [Hemicordylus capensis]|uniref:leucine-rich repeat neuronal protein 2 n=1 Tax=Hemicordylus capensis TaxID=884348 RepID=UPI002302700E|nr:leucine-rich repeat neuronal protein 2 [Hemicordylus capensis]XP_053102775.1 leucine-rich repeat neuronal protein 2 [Hemicordylus capensis]XP_053102776.1 leucine-rich repeat neuronal protein 2 [Hemicordylus capensis]XP_053102777.1 leucine-rich repeat neuronal protein 2 [Hemicordylus capensis]XP_053102778.1 leucine-rich repeat neuronal protein 2 [Hemicordylus capensis]
MCPVKAFALHGSWTCQLKMRHFQLNLLLICVATTTAIPVVPWKVKCPLQCVCQIRPWYTPRSVYREAATVDCNDLFISTVPESLPEGTQILLLQSNNIVKVEQSELDYLKNLTELDLSQNSFSDILDFSLKNMPHLLSFHLEENQLAELPDNSFSGLANLQELYLNHNQIRRISPKAFFGLGSLLRLHLNSNFLRTVDSRWFQVLPSLEILMIGGNKVDAILDMNFRALSNLRSLVLAGMNLKEISDYALEGLKSLESLSFYDNKLVNVPKRALQQVPGLKFLDLNKNPLQRIKQSDFTNMLHLKELGLNNMEELVSIDKFALINLPELTKLDVTNNPKLSYIHPSAFHHLPQMETLMLNNNALSALHKQTLESLPNLQEISIHSNPIRCDCVIRWVNSTENHIRFIEPQSTLCAEPPDLKRKHIRDVPFREMTDRCLPLISDKSFPSHLEVADGEDISLHCRALAEPEPEIYWVTPSGLKLMPYTDDGKYKVYPEGTIEIRKITAQEAGLYTCMAQNLIGADTRSISLMVNSSFPFSEDTLELLVKEVQAYHILVAWKPHLNTVASNLTWSSFSPSLDMTNVARIPTGTHMYNITRLHHSTEYWACLHIAFVDLQSKVACVSARTKEVQYRCLESRQSVLMVLSLCMLLLSISLIGNYGLGSFKPQAGSHETCMPWKTGSSSVRVVYPPFVKHWDQGRKSEKLLAVEAQAAPLDS